MGWSWIWSLRLPSFWIHELGIEAAKKGVRSTPDAKKGIELLVETGYWVSENGLNQARRLLGVEQ
jgi:hypothetical protein